MVLAEKGFGFTKGVVMFKPIFILLVIIGLSLGLAGNSSAVEISPSLEKYLYGPKKLGNDTTISVVVFAEDFQGSAKAVQASNKIQSNHDRHRAVVENLKNYRSSNLTLVINEIVNLGVTGQIREFWIAPAFSFDIQLSKLPELVNLPGIAAVYENGRLDYIKPVDMSLSVSASEAVRDHLTAMNVPSLWSRGYDGTGSLVCNFDTGVDGDHEALWSKWRGNHAASNACWYAPQIEGNIPQDNLGHGTQTMGIMMGQTPADTFGVAPGAEWIAAAVIDQGQSLEKTFDDILAAFQWAIDPDGNPETSEDVPDVILNSWGVPTTIMQPCDETFNAMIDAVEAAGIVTIFAAGNEGPDPYTLRLPANRAAGPLNAFAVGAIDHTTETIAHFSSRGPSSCDSVSIKPELVAPGVGIYTSYKDGAYRFTSGTSMAAPMIAGLVAIMRQYNPDATVAEIKEALINSCRDLGDPGEDNNYGHGLPDGDVLLSYLPTPSQPEINIIRMIVNGDGLAEPGETFDLFMRLETTVNAFDSISAVLSTEDSRVIIHDDYASFLFSKGDPQSININPYTIEFGGGLINGDVVDFTMETYLPGGVFYSTVPFSLTVGTAPSGEMFTHDNGLLKFTVSDFGMYGMSAGSIYPAGGEGFRIGNSDNLLYEAGIMVGRSPLQMSSSVRDSVGSAGRPDFTPSQTLATSYPARDGGFESRARFVDTESPIPIPIAVSQSITTYDNLDDNGYVVLRYSLVNSSLETLTNIYFGLFSDFDLSSDDKGEWVADPGFYLQSSSGYAVGISSLSDSRGMMAMTNDGGKTPLTQNDKFLMISASGVAVDEFASGDLMSVTNFGPYSISPFDSVEIALVIAAGSDAGEVTGSIQRAIERFNSTTAIDIADGTENLPNDYRLEQNYPNPFNPSTTIEFSMPERGKVTLDIINSLGQKIVTIYDDTAEPGVNRIVWDGTDRHGAHVATGVYFYRLQTEENVLTRKMVLLK